MFCRNCGKDVVDTAEFCPQCGARPLAGTGFCSACGSQTTALSEMCTKCGTRLRGAAPAAAPAPSVGNQFVAATGVSPKTKLIAFLLCTFLGTVGAHRFYVGRIGSAVGMILLSIAAWIFLGVAAVMAGINAGVGIVVGVIGNIIYGAIGIWVFVDWIMILVTKFKDKQGQVLTVWTK